MISLKKLIHGKVGPLKGNEAFFVSDRREEVSPAAVNRELSGLRNVYNGAIEWGMALVARC